MKSEKKYSERHEYYQYHQYQQQQGLYTNVSSNNNSIAYRNFVHSIKSPRSREKYAKSLQYYMNWLSLYDHDTILRKDPKLIASEIIDYIIYLKNEKKLAPATISTQGAAIHHFYEMNDVELILFSQDFFQG